MVLAIVATLSLFVAVLSWWAERNLFEASEFADRASVALDSAAVRRALADEIADRLVTSGVASLSSFRTVLVPLIEDVEQTDAFRQLFRAAVADVHRAVFERHADRALLELGDTLSILTATAKTTNKSVAAQLPSEATSLLIDVSPALKRIRPWRISERVGWLDDVAWIVAGAAAGGSVVLERRRRVAILRLGVGLAVVGAGVVTVTAVLPVLAAQGVHDEALAGAIRSGVRRFMSDLHAVGLWLIPIGVIVAAAASASGAPHLVRDARRAVASLRSWAGGPRPVARAAVGVGLMAIAVVLVLYRDSVLPFLVGLAGGLAGYVGLVLVLDAVLGEPAGAAESDRAEPRRRRTRTARVAAAGTAIVILTVIAVIAGGLAVARARDDARADTVLECNGFAELCDRRLDQVAFAGSHNSMSAALDPGWYFAENLTGIADQLNYGIRAFLVKSHYGIPTGVTIGGAELVVTDKAAEIANNAAAETDELSPEAVAKAEQLEATVPDDPSARGVYLCHVYCSLGATKFSTVLDEIKTFIERNPDEVIMLFIGDYVSPADTATEFDKAGLTDRLWTYDTSAPPPTLRQMIDARRNLLVLSEHAGGTPPWYTKGYGIFQDTPYTFAAPADFSCAPNRGPADAPLFEINHFITNKQPPSLDVAKKVNSYDFLMARVQQCEAERHKLPTIVAVNFYHQGDLLRVIDTLNGVPPRPG